MSCRPVRYIDTIDSIDGIYTKLGIAVLHDIYESVQLYDCAIVVTLVVCQDGAHFRIAEEGESCASA